MTENDNKIFLLNAINHILKQELTDISDETELVNLGLNSLDIVELQMHYEEKTNKILPDSSTPIKTIKDLLMLMQ